METPDSSRLSRRDAVKWILTASATIGWLAPKQYGAAPIKGTPYGADPNLMLPEITWDLTLTEQQLRTTRALCDVILPKTEDSPSASELNVADFIDEWVSSPYEQTVGARKAILEGLQWLDSEAQSRFDQEFADLSEAQQREICDDICYLPRASARFQKAARFFATFRNLTMGGYYTTPEGMKACGYVGNVALATFDGPPPEVLDRLGVTPGW